MQWLKGKCIKCGNLQVFRAEMDCIGTVLIICHTCEADEARSPIRQPTPLDPNGPQAVGTARDEPSHMGTKTEGTQG